MLPQAVKCKEELLKKAGTVGRLWAFVLQAKSELEAELLDQRQKRQQWGCPEFLRTSVALDRG